MTLKRLMDASEVWACQTDQADPHPEVEATQLATARSSDGLEALAAPALQVALPPVILATLAQIGLQVALGSAESPASTSASVGQMTTPDILPPALVAVLAQFGHKVPPVAAAVLVEVDGIAAVLGVTRWTVYRWASEGRIPCIRAGRKVRFEMERVIAALRSEGPRAQTPPGMASVPVTAPSCATRTALPRERSRRRQVAGGIPRALPPHRVQPTVSAQRKRPAARQEPVDEIARRRSIVAATRALAE